ncbi:MAG: sterol desaturase family protein [bacterium]
MTKRYVSNKDESIPLFESKYLDKFTYVHPSVPVILYLPVITFFMYRAAVHPMLSSSTIFILFFSGMFLWTLTEYLGHRFIFHYETKSHFGNYIHHLIHGVHHDYPNDSRRLVMPPVVSIPLALLFYGLFWLLLGGTYELPCYAGFVFGYVCYDMIHYATHHFSMKTRLGMWLKHHHIRHHYQNEKLGFGVSSPLWDYIFGTTHAKMKKKRLESPRKHEAGAEITC